MRKILLIITLLACPSFLFAMTCMTEKVKERYKKADYVFEATVIKRVKLEEKGDGICWYEGESCGAKIATVNIGEIWKGSFPSNTTTIYSEDGCYCLGTYFPVGSKYIVFGKKSDQNSFEVFDMGGCSTESYEYIEKKTLKKLDKLRKRANQKKQKGSH